MFIFKDGINSNNEEIQTQLLDAVTEGIDAIGGFLSLDDSRKPDSYTFKITDYISELASGDLNDLQPLGVKVLNPTDLPVTLVDTIVRMYNWNPKAVMLLNHEGVNGSRRATLKISYSEKTQQNN